MVGEQDAEDPLHRINKDTLENPKLQINPGTLSKGGAEGFVFPCFVGRGTGGRRSVSPLGLSFSPRPRGSVMRCGGWCLGFLLTIPATAPVASGAVVEGDRRVLEQCGNFGVFGRVAL